MIDFEKVLSECSDPKVGLSVLNAIEALFLNDRKLLEIDVAERTIAAQLAHYLAPQFGEHVVDVEYNRMGEIPKEIVWNKDLEKVYPDIIVHLRMTDNNFLVIELKKDSNNESKNDDILKLKAYKRSLGYLHALFIRFGVKENAGTMSECEWVQA